MGKRGRPQGVWVKKDDRLFILKVALIGGPVSEAFLRQNPVVSRTIQLRGDQTLGQLHCAIFAAFDREEEHMYEFQIGATEPNDPEAERYVLPMALERFFPDDKPEGSVANTTIGSLGLDADDTFFYWFDFGDSWWHQITVSAIVEKAPAGDYPRITDQVGESPPQYPDFEEEE